MPAASSPGAFKVGGVNWSEVSDVAEQERIVC